MERNTAMTERTETREIKETDPGRVRSIALNLGEMGLPAEKIARALGTDRPRVVLWMEEAGMDPEGRNRIRQKEGIAAAKARGVKFGRPRVELPDSFGETVRALENREITSKEAVRRSGLSESTFYRRLREYRRSRNR